MGLALPFTRKGGARVVGDEQHPVVLGLGPVQLLWAQAPAGEDRHALLEPAGQLVGEALDRCAVPDAEDRHDAR